MQRWSPIVELRQYTLHPGKRDVLIDLFEAEFVETQEAVGMKVIGIFGDLDDPDRFVWLRGFETMESRACGLDVFYGGPVWRRHREAANATMIDSDDVLLLRPATAAGGFVLPDAPPARDAPDDPERGTVAALVLELQAPASAELVAHLSETISARVAAAGGTPLAVLVSEERENTYPRLPVRENVHAFVSFAGYPSSDRRAVRQGEWDELVRAADANALHAPRVLRLLPTRRSPLAGVSLVTAAPGDGDPRRPEVR